jgi:serine/threonine protein kinase
MYDITQTQKNKWAADIELTLKALHNQGIFWIDVKTTNVLIEETTDDAWIVDFGGGNTCGWVDADIAGTLKGDLQGLAKIKTRLGVQ